MEKTIAIHSSLTTTITSSASNKHAIWDCGSSLYDSFELKSFEKQLNSAIVSRSLSMPHLSHTERRTTLPSSSVDNKKPTGSKISRSFHRLLRAVFGSKNVKNSTSAAAGTTKFMQECSGDGFYVFNYGDRSAVLSTIPEVPEFDAFSPEIRNLVRKTASDRLGASAVATSVGMSCSSIGISGHFSI